MKKFTQGVAENQTKNYGGKDHEPFQGSKDNYESV